MGTVTILLIIIAILSVALIIQTIVLILQKRALQDLKLELSWNGISTHWSGK